MKIFLDPGHGGKDPGAVGPTGLRESSVALGVAERLTRFLASAGHDVEISRADDATFVELEERAAHANRWGADLFVSIHCNASHDPAVRGFEVWTTPGQTEADKLAQSVFMNVGRAFPGEPGRKDTSDGDSDKEKKFYVLAHTKAPAILVETGFISHPETEAAMRSLTWMSGAAAAIAAGIIDWIRA